MRDLVRAGHGLAVIAEPKRRTHRCDESCVCPIDRLPTWYAPSTGQHACQDPECAYAHPDDRASAVG